jgi:hypothetical protein
MERNLRCGLNLLVRLAAAGVILNACGDSAAQCGGMPCHGPAGLPCRCTTLPKIPDAAALGKGEGSAGDSGSTRDGGPWVSSIILDAGAPALDSSTRDSAAATQACRWPESLNDAGPGVRACGVGRAFVECTYPSGAGCGCISDDPTSCPGCGPASGATCRSRCAPNEYAVSCGGPPALPLPDGSFASLYQDAPDACVGVAGTPAGNLYSCCPCE